MRFIISRTKGDKKDRVLSAVYELGESIVLESAFELTKDEFGNAVVLDKVSNVRYFASSEAHLKNALMRVCDCPLLRKKPSKINAGHGAERGKDVARQAVAECLSSPTGVTTSS